MSEYKISDKLNYALARDNTKIEMSYAGLDDGSVWHFAEITVQKDYLDYTFEVNCGKPTSVKELEEGLVQAVGKFVGDEDDLADRIADQYFRDNLETVNIREAIEYGEVIKEALTELRSALKVYLYGI